MVWRIAIEPQMRKDEMNWGQDFAIRVYPRSSAVIDSVLVAADGRGWMRESGLAADERGWMGRLECRSYQAC
jgi:hypothetical protein